MGRIIPFNKKRLFTLGEAKELLPVVRRITQSAHDEATYFRAQFNYVSDQSAWEELEETLYATFQVWHEKLRKLGCEARGMWLVDFDCGKGYYCWKFPEPEVNHFHGYTDGFRGRVRIH